MASDSSDRARGAEFVYDALLAAGVELLVGLPGTQTLPLDRVVTEREEMRYVMARHETAIPHIVWGYYEACGRPAATLTVPGPGDTNAMHGLKNAHEDCVPLIHVSADVDPDERGKGPIHEIEPDTYDNVVKANLTVENPLALRETVARGIETALTPPYGPVRLGIPSGFLAREVTAPAADVDPETVAFHAGPAVERAAALLGDADRPVVYAGGGARRSADGPEAVRALAERLDAPVVVSYKGKGVFPEDDPRFLGVTAAHIPAGARRVLDAADVVLALGTDFDGVTTGHWEVPMGDALVHVNLAPGAIDAVPEYAADVAVVGDVGDVGAALLERLSDDAGGWNGGRIADAVQREYRDHLDDSGLLAETTPAYTPAVLRAIREVVPREATVATDIGGHRLWAKQVFPAYAPEGYVTAGSWAGMGVGLPGAVGAALARDDPVICLHGDGGLMMCIHELHTAVEEDLDLTVVVFDNADYGIISKSPEIREYGEGHRFAWDAPDFAAIAEGFGCRGVRAESPSAAADAVDDALDADGPVVVDVAIRTDEPSVVDAAEYESTVTLDEEP